MRSTFTLDEAVAQRARLLGVNVSAAARDGVVAAVRRALAEADRQAYRKKPEETEDSWDEVEKWGKP